MRLIETYISKIGAILGQQATDIVLDLGGGHPFFLQVAFYWALELQYTKGAPLEYRDVNILKRSMYGEFEPHFEYYWKHLTPREQYVLAALPVTRGEEIYREELKSLSSLCLVAGEDGQYEYFSPLFHEFVRFQKLPDMLQAGPFVILRQRRAVLMQEKLVALGGKQFDLLTYLVQHRGRVVSNEELDREVMASPEERQEYQFVDDDRLKRAIRALRKALGDTADCIVNKRGVGYMFQVPTEEKPA